MDISLISAAEVRTALSQKEWVAAADEAFRVLSSGAATSPQRLIADLPPGYLALMPGAVHVLGTFGAKIVTLLPGNPAKSLPAIQGFVALFSSETGAPVALIDGAELTLRRTAAASASATRALARRDAGSIGIFGSGPQARAHAEALAAVLKVTNVTLWARDPEKARAVAAEIERSVGVPARATTFPEEAAEADVVCAVTGSANPVVSGRWLRPGAHVNLVGAYTPTTRELDTDGVRAGRVYVDCLSAASTESGDILIPMQEGAIGPDHVVGEIGQVLCGESGGRQSPKEITVFKSLGHAVEDLVAADAVWRAHAAQHPSDGESKLRRTAPER